jgi:hypothetical protein
MQIHGHLSSYPPGAGQKNPTPLGIRLRAPFTASDEKPPDPSVVQCGPQLLGRPLFNRRKAQFLHPTVLASGETSAHHRRVLPRLHLGVLDVALVQRPFLIRPSSKDRFLIWLLNIYKVLFVEKTERKHTWPVIIQLNRMGVEKSCTFSLLVCSIQKAHMF